MGKLYLKPKLSFSELALQCRDEQRGIHVVVYPRLVMTGAYGIKTTLHSFQAHFLTQKVAEKNYKEIVAEVLDSRGSECRRYIGKPSIHSYDAFEVQDQLTNRGVIS